MNTVIYGTATALLMGVIMILFLTHKIMQVVYKIIDFSVEVSVATDEISKGNINLSQRTEEQAASLEETSSSMQQITTTVEQNANNAKFAASLASEAREKAQQGGKIVNATTTAILEINNSSEKISEIISVIDEIAFQTNLLALNAAVEAARAGEQGRGFAVVAVEVRHLAQRSATSAKETKVLIRDSVNKMGEGMRLVGQSGKALEEIVLATGKVNDIVSEISLASQEQAAGIQQVSKAVLQLDEITQQNGALVEQAAAASESLQEQAENLKKHILFFGISKRHSLVKVAARSSALTSNAIRNIATRRKNEVMTHDPSSPIPTAKPTEEWKDF